MGALMMFAMEQMLEPMIQAVIFSTGLGLAVYVVVSLYHFIYQSFGG